MVPWLERVSTVQNSRMTPESRRALLARAEASRERGGCESGDYCTRCRHLTGGIERRCPQIVSDVLVVATGTRLATKSLHNESHHLPPPFLGLCSLGREQKPMGEPDPVDQHPGAERVDQSNEVRYVGAGHEGWARGRPAGPNFSRRRRGPHNCGTEVTGRGTSHRLHSMSPLGCLGAAQVFGVAHPSRVCLFCTVESLGGTPDGGG